MICSTSNHWSSTETSSTFFLLYFCKKVGRLLHSQPPSLLSPPESENSGRLHAPSACSKAGPLMCYSSVFHLHWPLWVRVQHGVTKRQFGYENDDIKTFLELTSWLNKLRVTRWPDKLPLWEEEPEIIKMECGEAKAIPGIVAFPQVREGYLSDLGIFV